MITDIKREIGNRIRQEREKQNLTREQLCDTEQELTVKQLMRIELGRSLPTIVKLQYISDRLGVSLSFLLGEKTLDIPEEYFKAKYKLMKSHAYGNPNRIKQKQKLIEDIYNQFFEILPEEELLTLDLLERTLNFISSEDKNLVESIFDDYFKQILSKNVYTLNDVLLVKYYAIQCQDFDYDQENLENCQKTLLQQKLRGDEIYNIELLSALSAIAGIYVTHHNYKNMKNIVDKMYEIMNKTMQYSCQPGILIFEAKYYLYYEHNKEKAEELYDLATILAENFGDKVFIKNLAMEKERDLK